MTMAATEPTACPGCPTCQHTQLLTEAAAALDPDRLANSVRRRIRDGVTDEIDTAVILLGPGRELAVDTASGHVWEGLQTRTPQEQLQLALTHLAAALAAGAKL
ncbi:hypothetical protein PP568_06800 [Mycobacteroides abscessus]|uniref:YbaB/EbfC DNA-binding family protein n=2 Tax=Mycobacteroides abscessus TaxID=36809 RepID=A0AB38D2V7_9MYCO|nr:hypothetical protein [Mycobacteroides abscessus]MBE5419564.1 hypothetical protein [Mycobacteroides abscessus]MBE5455737.1 hypothetical protein [Mycobacteroides abscessus]MBN7555247.1 hypothetical protein [Mycobacteroides abscessus subsp. abscessus]MDM2404639.1 hypothetical protein [Mycobacteroides abscessus]MDM2414357.1 hypothetical protein [Mycobacteroides abscessus]